MRKLYLFCLGAVGYAMLEIAFRGRTHWTMLLTGGVCAAVIDLLSRHVRRLWLLCLLGGLFITAAELAVGLIVNRALGWEVWDYTGVPWNLMGQICPMFSAFWVLLTAPASAMCRLAGRRFGPKRGRRR